MVTPIETIHDSVNKRIQSSAKDVVEAIMRNSTIIEEVIIPKSVIENIEIFISQLNLKIEESFINENDLEWAMAGWWHSLCSHRNRLLDIKARTEQLLRNIQHNMLTQSNAIRYNQILSNSEFEYMIDKLNILSLKSLQNVN